MTQEVPNAYLTGLPRYWVSTQVVSTQTEIQMGTDPIRTYLRIFGLGIQPWFRQALFGFLFAVAGGTFQ